MAALPSRTTCIGSMFLFLTLLALPATQGVFIKDKRKHQNSGERRRGSKEDPTEDTVERSNNNNRRHRESFSRTVVLCNDDDECGRKFFCHGGEGHKSCLPCRKSRRRCNRDGMCCHGRVCMEGKCVPAEARYDGSYHTTRWQSDDEESISQHTKEGVRKRREGETCTTADSCNDGLCCAQHFWSRICKRILEEGDVCTKKKDRLTSIFQRCHCGKSLRCKRDTDSAVRVFSCQVVKDRPSSSKRKESSKEVVAERIDESSVFEEARIGVAWDTSRELESDLNDINEAIFRTENDHRPAEIETQDVTIL